MTQKIDNPDIEVVVVGAGPAGGSCARELAKLGRKVLLIERSNELGEPNFSSAGTPKSTVEDFKLPQECIAASWKRFFFGGPTQKAIWEYPSVAGYVFDFRKLKQFLAHDAISHGAEVLVGTSVTDAVMDARGRIGGVVYSGALGSGSVRAKVVVDASGPPGVLAAKPGLRKGKLCNPAVGIEILAENVPAEWHDTLAFWVGRSVAPYGHAWLFPMGGSGKSRCLRLR